MADQMTGLFSPFLQSRRTSAVRPLPAQASVLNFRGAGARFLVLSGISFSTNLGLTSGLHELAGVKAEIAFAVTLAVVLVTNFIGMRYFVYTGRQGNIIKQFVSFLLSSSGFRGLEYVLFLVLHTWLGLAYRLAIIATLATTFVTKFFFYGAVVFSRPEATSGPSVSAAAERPEVGGSTERGGRAGGGARESVVFAVGFGIIAVVWFYILSGLLYVTPGAVLTRQINVFFNLDTALWIRGLSGNRSPEFSVTHPLRSWVWEKGGTALCHLLQFAGPPETVRVVVGRALNALVAGVGLGCLVLVGLCHRLPRGVCLALMPLFLLFTVNLLVVLPEHFGLSNGLLSITFAIYCFEITPLKKALILLFMTVFVAGLTTTNGLFPFACLCLVVSRHRGQILPRPWQFRAVVLSAVALAAALGSLVAVKSWDRVRGGESKILKYLNCRLLHTPGSAAVYALHGMIDPVVGPTPKINPHDYNESQVTLITYEPLTLWPFDWVQGVAAAVWLVLFGTALAGALRDATVRPQVVLLLAWIIFNLLFHNVWGDEFFMFSTHWSWSLTMIVLLGARAIPQRWLVALAVPIVAGQVHTLLAIREMLGSL